MTNLNKKQASLRSIPKFLCAMLSCMLLALALPLTTKASGGPPLAWNKEFPHLEGKVDQTLSEISLSDFPLPKFADKVFSGKWTWLEPETQLASPGEQLFIAVFEDNNGFENAYEWGSLGGDWEWSSDGRLLYVNVTVNVRAKPELYIYIHAINAD